MATIRGPPTNSASVNCHPMRMAMMIPSSATRFVDASMKVIADVKFAPFRKIERANAAAAYEQDDDAAPSRLAIAIDLGESSGSNLVICFLETTACTIPERPNPRISAQRISQNMAKAILRA